MAKQSGLGAPQTGYMHSDNGQGNQPAPGTLTALLDDAAIRMGIDISSLRYGSSEAISFTAINSPAQSIAASFNLDYQTPSGMSISYREYYSDFNIISSCVSAGLETKVNPRKVDWSKVEPGDLGYTKTNNGSCFFTGTVPLKPDPSDPSNASYARISGTLSTDGLSTISVSLLSSMESNESLIPLTMSFFLTSTTDYLADVSTWTPPETTDIGSVATVPHSQFEFQINEASDTPAIPATLNDGTTANDLELSVRPSLEALSPNSTDFDPVSSPLSLGLLLFGTGWKLTTDGRQLNQSQFVNGQISNTASAAFTQILSDGFRPGDINAAPSVIAPDLSKLGSGFYDNAPDQAGASLNAMSNLARNSWPTDPLVLDLNGDGVRLTDYASRPVLFDIDHDGASEQTGWVSASDGLVVADRNGNGIIDDSGELLSEYFGGAAGVDDESGIKPYTNGFAALASLDVNHDGWFDSRDNAWNLLRVWVDTNHDGHSWIDANGNRSFDAGETNELHTFGELGITSIELSSQKQSGAIRDGNEVLATGGFLIDGRRKEALAANFLSNPLGSTSRVDGSGVIVQSGDTASYVAASDKGERIDVAEKKVNNALGAAGNDTLIGDAGNNWLAGGAGSDSFDAGAGDDVLLIDADDLPSHIHGGTGMDIVQVVGKRGVMLNLAQAEVEIAQGGVGRDVLIGGGRSSVFMRGGDGDDVLIGGAANDALSGENGDDMLDGLTGNDVLRGGRGADVLFGGEGDDLLDGGLDDDRLVGGAGNDILKGGNGNDTIDGGDGIDVLELAGSYADYRISREGDGYRISDTAAGRDGSDFVRNVEKLNFSDLGLVDMPDNSDKAKYPLSVKDVLDADASGKAFDHKQPHLIAASQLLGNDFDRGLGAIRIDQIYDAIGGTATLTDAGDVLFTPDDAYTGLMGFKYGIVNVATGLGTEIIDTSSGNRAPMRSAVYLRTPELPRDPLLPDQWYLSEANILPVWRDYTGRGIRIAEFEANGPFSVTKEIFDYRHPDLRANVDAAWLANPNPGERAGEGSEDRFSNHATLVAGVMVAASNGEGGVGVAFDASIAGYWLSAEDYSAIGHMQEYEVANSSWAAIGNFTLRYSPAALGRIYAPFEDAIRYGRDGLGTVIVNPGGNARQSGGNTNYSNASNNRSAIVVGAVNAATDLGALRFGGKPFSNPGASILVAAPGSNVTSTARMVRNASGSSFGADAQSVQGTSFATPIVSGIVALMLEANPNLGYRDVQEILALSATRVDDPATSWAENGARTWNGGGMLVSHDYGYGEVDARAAVRLAETWITQQTAANEHTLAVAPQTGSIELTIPDGDSNGVFSTLHVADAAIRIEHVEVLLDISHANAGDLIVKLRSPSGTESVLIDRPGKAPGDAADRGDVGFNGSDTLRFVLNTALLRGESSNGDWTLQVIDAASGGSGVLHGWSMNVYGAGAEAPLQYVYTNAYAQLSPQAGRNSLSIAPGSTATINAAAISSGSRIDLSIAQATLAGNALQILNPEAVVNAIGGEGDDILTGNSGNNLLIGGRGSDVLNGGDGDDTLDAGIGNDTLTGGAGADLFIIGKHPGDSDVINDASAADVVALVGLDDSALAGITRIQVGTDVRIDLGHGQTVWLRNRSLQDLEPGLLRGFADMQALRLWQSACMSAATMASLADGESALPSAAGAALPAIAIIRKPSAAIPILTGTNTADTLIGDAGGNLIDGGPGADRMEGRSGDDTYVVDAARDAIVEVAGGGYDLAQASVSYALPDEVEELQLTGAAAIDGTGNALDNRIRGNDAANVLDGGAGADTLVGGDGDDIYVVDDSGDRIVEAANEGVDLVRSSISFALGAHLENLQLTGKANIAGYGNAQDNRITGNDGDNLLIGAEGDDTLDGAGGNDVLIGGAGNDRYLFGVGAGDDRIVEEAGPAGGIDTLVLGAGIGVDDVVLERAAQGWQLRLASGERIALPGTAEQAAIETIAFDDGTVWKAEDFAQRLDRIPAGFAQLRDVIATEDQALRLALSATAFTDASGKALPLVATLADGSPLPAWLRFDANSRSFAGQPDNDAVGDFDILVQTSADIAQSQSGRFRLSVVNVNYAPRLTRPLSAQQGLEDTACGFSLPDDAYTDVDAGDTLHYSARLADGAALPEWLRFDADNRSFSGLPGAAAVGTLSIVVSATDAAGARADGAFDLTIEHVNHAPRLVQTIGKQMAVQGKPFYFALPQRGFIDVDAGDTLTYTVAMADGKPLPEWLSFDAASASLRGTPAASGRVDVAVAVDDHAGGNASTTIRIQVAPPTPTGLPDTGAPGFDGVATDDALHGGDEADILRGKAGNDTLWGYEGDDRLYGGAGNDVLRGGDGNDSLDGGPGNDKLEGGAGSDSYFLYRGMGADRIDDSGFLDDATDVVYIGDGIGIDGLWLRKTGFDELEISVIGTDDRLTIEGWDSRFEGWSVLYPNRIEQFRLADGTLLLPDQIERMASAMAAYAPPQQLEDMSRDDHAWLCATILAIAAEDHAPVPSAETGDLEAWQGLPFALSMPVGMFSDVDAGDALRFSMTLADGAALPAWMRFDPQSGVLSGTPEQSGALALRLVATDDEQGSSAATMTLHIAGPTYGTSGSADSDFLVGTQASEALFGKSGNDMLFGLGDADLLVGGDGNDVLFGGDGDDYLQGDDGNDTLDGGPGNDMLSGGRGTDTYVLERGMDADTIDDFGRSSGNSDVIKLDAGLTADQLWFQRSGAQGLQIGIAGSGDSMTIIDWYAPADGISTALDASAERLRFSDDAFLTANQVNRLVDAMARFAPPSTSDWAADASYAAIRADAAAIAAENHQPHVMTAIADQRAYRGKAFEFTVPAAAFQDPDRADTLSFSATSADGKPLPSWLSFDPVRRSLHGTPPNLTPVDVRITASDSRGGSAASNFKLSIAMAPLIVNGTSGMDVLVGQSGDDVLYGGEGNDSLYGGPGKDTLYGDGGNDVLDGGPGNDRLHGDAGNDTYLMYRGMGQDAIIEYDATPGNADTLQMTSRISPEQLWFRKTDWGDLTVSIIGTADSMTIENWGRGEDAGSQNPTHIERFRLADGRMLLDAQVNQLVDAMAAFAPPAMGQTTLPDDYRTALMPVLAANWK
ncbi:putative Ig domain-containing protein [Noviherbaspirillum pedocola]|nr:putative Ig domain-containing protein [Noviherbaspirillum pedocola]